MNYILCATSDKPILNQYSKHTIDMGALYGKVYPEFTARYYRKTTNGMQGYMITLKDGYKYIKLESGHYVPYVAKYWKRVK